MSVRALVAIILVALPLAAEAQVRMPRIGNRGPARPAPLPAVPSVLNREMRYVQRPYTVESYPLIAYYTASGLGQGTSSWTGGGVGTRFDLKLTRIVSLTLDMTSTFVGGPVYAQTVELGTRFRPGPSEAKWYPFFDLRAGYALTADKARPVDLVSETPALFARTHHGFGYVAGTGLEYALHPRVALTAAATYLRADLSPVFNPEYRPIRGSSTLSAARYSVGVRYNPGRWTRPANLPQPRSGR
jgi:opacity protein-like surface antigen